MTPTNSPRQEIISTISKRVLSCIADCNTYLYVKSTPQAKTDLKDPNLGGGNFVVLLATFSVIDLLSQVNCILDGSPLYNAEDIKLLRRERNKTPRRLKQYVHLPKQGMIKSGNGYEQFKRLLLANAESLKITEKGIENLYSIRHKITHVFSPQKIPAGAPKAEDIQKRYQGHYQTLLQDYDRKPIKGKSTEGKDCIDVHAFNHKLKILLDFVLNKLQSKEPYATELATLFHWLAKN